MSDGELSPRALVGHYEHAGFDVVALTDHWVRADAPSRRVVVLRGAELNATLAGSGRDAHVLGLGLDADPEPPESSYADLPETVAWVLERGGLPYLAHPYWSGLRTSEFESCPGLAGIEIWNAGCSLEVGRGTSAPHWDEALESGGLLYGIATDDSHHPGFDSALAWVWARSAERSGDAVLDALRRGAFYSSSGPRIESLRVGDDAVEVRCTPAVSVTLVAGAAKGASVHAGRLGYRHHGSVLAEAPGGEIAGALLERPARAAYGRVEVRDASGRIAWTNLLWTTAR
jgi:hypothetical protein